MEDYVTSLKIGNCNELFQTVVQYLSSTPPKNSQIIYLWGMGCNGKSVFLDAMRQAIEKAGGYQVPNFPLPDLTEIAVFKSELFVPNHSSKIGVICYHEDHLSGNLENLMGVVDEWSTLSGLHRCYFVMSNQPITDTVLRSQLTYCEFPQTFTPGTWTDVQSQNAIESVHQNLKLHMTSLCGV